MHPIKASYSPENRNRPAPRRAADQRTTLLPRVMQYSTYSAIPHGYYTVLCMLSRFQVDELFTFATAPLRGRSLPAPPCRCYFYQKRRRSNLLISYRNEEIKPHSAITSEPRREEILFWRKSSMRDCRYPDEGDGAASLPRAAPIQQIAWATALDISLTT